MTTLIPKFDFKNGGATPAGAVNRAINLKLAETVSVTDFGADSTGAAASDTAFASAWASIKNTGGVLLIPPGTYLLNNTWNCDIDLTTGRNYLIIGYGATLTASSSVTGWAMNVTGGYNNFGVTIEGIQFNQLGNTTISGAIKAVGSANLKILRCVIQLNNNNAAYYGVYLDTNSYWTLIDGLTTRQSSGNSATYSPVAIGLIGQANATKIINCSLGGVVYGIFIGPYTDGSMCNGLRILHNDFEGVTNAIVISTSAPCNTTPTGVFVAFNRAESCTSFIVWTGAAVTNASQPLVSQSNYLTVGSVTNYLVNPNNQYVFTQESSFFGVPIQNYIGSPSNFNILANATGANLQITTTDGTSTWARAHLVFGSTYNPQHLWVDASGKLRIKSGAPTSDTDGTVVGTQS